MDESATALYEGTVYHRRLKVDGWSPVENAFKYPVFMCLVDLKDVQLGAEKNTDVFGQHHALWSLNGRSNVCAFHREDYFGDPKRPLDDCVRDVVEAQTGARPHGPIRMLCNIRYFGYTFNPVCIYYCFDVHERLESVLLEVSNTPWLEKRLYVLNGITRKNGSEKFSKHLWRKDFHVSPFQDLEQDYEWEFISSPSKESSKIYLRATSYRSDLNKRRKEEAGRRNVGSDEDHTTGSKPTRYVESTTNEKTFEVVLTLRRRPLSFWSLNWALSRYPMMTGVAQLYIHYQAAKVFIMGVKYVEPPKESPKLGIGTLLFHLMLFAVAMVFWLIGSLVGTFHRCFCGRGKRSMIHEN